MNQLPEFELPLNVEWELMLRDIAETQIRDLFIDFTVLMLTGYPLEPTDLILEDRVRLHLLLYNWIDRN